MEKLNAPPNISKSKPPKGNDKPGGGSQVPDRQQGKDASYDNVDIVDTSKDKKA